MIRFQQGHVLDILKNLPDGSVHCVVTSPPYWGLRDYKLEPQVWPDAWRGSLGLEPTPDLYIEHLVAVFREVRRVLRKDGTCWVNIGDSYARDPAKGQHRPGDSGKQAYIYDGGNGRASATGVGLGLKEKDLCLIPFRLAIALQADGWWIRSDIIWSKTNPLPESVRDRPSKSHEYLFMLTRSSKYYFDREAVREPVASYKRKGGSASYTADGAVSHGVGSDSLHQMAGQGRNLRSVWTIATQPFPEAHFAVFPEKLAEPCVKAGCPPNGTTLDPFAGAGTVALVSAKLGRSHIGIELNPDFIAMAEKRLER